MNSQVPRTILAIIFIYEAAQNLHFRDQKAYGAVYAENYERMYKYFNMTTEMNPLTPLLYSTFTEKFVYGAGAFYAIAAIVVFLRIQSLSWLYFIVQFMLLEHIAFYNSPTCSSSSMELIESLKLLGLVGVLFLMVYGSDMGYLSMEDKQALLDIKNFEAEKAKKDDDKHQMYKKKKFDQQKRKKQKNKVKTQAQQKKRRHKK